MKRVVVTGLGMVSCIGNDRTTVTAALRNGRSGLSAQPAFAEAGMRSRVAGVPDTRTLPLPERKLRRFMSEAALYGWQAAVAAIEDARLDSARVSHPRTGLIVGSGVGSTMGMMEAMRAHGERGMERILPYVVPQVMGSTVSANLASALSIKGVSYGLTSACATSAHCIGHAAELIQLGKQDVVIAGGAEEVSWHSAMLFDAMGVLAEAGNANPAQASRPYHRQRDGFVIAGGAAVLILESLEHALARKAPILAELSGYGATSDGAGMVNPSGEGAERAMRLALGGVQQPPDYINTHATGTEQGDMVEVDALRKVFGEEVPNFSSTKALTGHAIAASGSLESCFCLLMMENGFMAATANLDEVDADMADAPVLTRLREAPVETALCNSFGFGGTNASLLFSRLWL